MSGAGVIAALTEVVTPRANVTAKKTALIVMLAFPCLYAPDRFAAYHSSAGLVDFLRLESPSGGVGATTDWTFAPTARVGNPAYGLSTIERSR